MRSVRQGMAVETTASFPNPAQDYYQGPLSLDRHLIRRPTSTFVLRLSSDALEGIGLRAGDELVVDRSLDPLLGRVLVVVDDQGEHRVGRFEIHAGQAVLVSKTEAIPLNADVVPWGVVVFGIRHVLEDSSPR